MNELPTIWKVGLALLKVKSDREDPLYFSIFLPAKAELLDDIEKQSQSTSGGHLFGEILQNYIQKTFSVNFRQNSIYKLLKSLNITWTTSRSIHSKQFEEAQ